MFALKEGEISAPQRVARGWVVGTVSGRQEPYVPALDEVKDRVRDDVVPRQGRRARQAARGRHRRRAEDREGLRRGREEARPRGEDDRAARARRGDPRHRHERGGRCGRVLAARWAASAIRSPRPAGTAIVRVVERQDVTDAQIAAGRDELRDELTSQRRDRFFSAYMQKAKSGLNINVDQDAADPGAGRSGRSGHAPGAAAAAVRQQTRAKAEGPAR